MAGKKQRALGAATIEVVGPTSTLAKRVATVLEQHGHTGAVLGGAISGRKRARAGISRRGGKDSRADRVTIDVSAAESPRAYVVNALKPDGSTAPTEVREQVQSVREREPDAPVFVLLDEANAEAVQAARQAGATDFFSAAVAANPAAVEWRVDTMLTHAAVRRGIPPGAFLQPAGRVRRMTRRAPHLHVSLGAPVEPTTGEVAEALARVEAGLKRLPTPQQALARAAKLTTVAAPELCDERSGRFDARRVAERLGVSINRLAPATGVSQQALSKRPDSPRAQKGLSSIARVLAALDELHPAAAAKMWLNAPRPTLGGAAPLELILQGRADAVARMLERALEGIPG
jgi:DNA-binding NarL/FixJ family response regulator